MDSVVVIKVKYGETLRRFNAHVNEAGQIDLDIGRLREKVLGLFNFAPNADLTLTYIDEDGDAVTLVDEEDLSDVMRQSLNPLRITVKLNAEKGGRLFARSSGNSTPMRSPRVQYPLPNLNGSVSECLKSVPEPLLETLSKMALDLASKAEPSSSVLVELVDCFSKMGLSYINPVSEFQAGVESSTLSGASGSAISASITKEKEVLRDDGATFEVFPNAKSEVPTSEVNQKVDCVNSTLYGGLPVDSLLSANLASGASLNGVGDSKGRFKKVRNPKTGTLVIPKTVTSSVAAMGPKAGNSPLVIPKTVMSSVAARDNTMDVKKSGEGCYSVTPGAFPSKADTLGHSIMDTTTNLGSDIDAKFSSVELVNKCPFVGMQVANGSAMSSAHCDSRVHPLKRSYTHSGGMGGIVHRGIECDGCGVHPICGPRFKSKVKEDYDLCSMCFSETVNEADYIRMDHPTSHLNGRAGNSERVNPRTVTSSVPASNNTEDVKKSGEGWNSITTAAFPSTADTMGHSILDTTASFVGGIDAKFPSMKLVNQCPFAGMQGSNDSAVSCTNYNSRVHPFQRSYTLSDGMGIICHRGVQCDGCGVHPIRGPRFKSKVKANYDLCSVCFSEMGDEADYIRMDHPLSFRHPPSLKGLCVPVRPPILPRVPRVGGNEPSRLKLNSCFITDVSVLDGTLMAPSTPFTKIWRLRNNGTVVWPQGTQLVWIGGDKLSASLSADLQISVDGVPVGNELDVAADFTAPELPGRYISYWRMAAPSGEKFGQRFWVLIQVDAPPKDLSDSFQGLNLNLPPEDTGLTDPETINVNVDEPMMVEGSLPEPDNSDRALELFDLSVGASPSMNEELNFPTNDTLLVGEGVSNTVPPETRTPVSFPITQIASAVPSSHVSSPTTIVPATVQGTSEDNAVEQTLLKELEEMGFKQVDLNKEILRLNAYNLEQSLDDLCGIAEWDPILEELEEMGFCDKEMNKKLLMKNNGSIKRVVMDLITGDKA